MVRSVCGAEAELCNVCFLDTKIRTLNTRQRLPARSFSPSQVILDVVYNHTNEGDDAFPYTTSYRAIDCTVSRGMR